MKKIIVVAPALTMGGMERASVNLSNGLSRSGFEMTFMTILKKEHFFSLDAGIKIIEPESFNMHSLSIFKTITWIRNEITRINPEKIIVYNKFYGAIVGIAILGLKFQYYVSERSSPLYFWELKYRIINKLAFNLNPPTGVIAQTSIAKHYQALYYPKIVPIEVIPNVLREVKLFPLVERENVILAIGRLNEDLKGFDQLLSAFALLKNKDWRLVFAGGEQYRSNLTGLAKKLKIQERITYLGKVKNIDRVMAGAGLFVIPSRSEGFPNALVEAMAAWLPVISFDFIAGPRDIITHSKNGIIVENGNIEKLAKQIDKLIIDNNLRNKLSNEAQKVRCVYLESSIINKYKDFLNI